MEISKDSGSLLETLFPRPGHALTGHQPHWEAPSKPEQLTKPHQKETGGASLLRFLSSRWLSCRGTRSRADLCPLGCAR